MDDLSNLIAIFLIFIVPLWIFLHYRTKAKLSRQPLSDEDKQRLEELEKTAFKMRERVKTLEKILDNKCPDWRN
jgi:phage shock protein B